MATPNLTTNDLELLWVPPQSDTDERVPTAQEMAAGSHLHQQNLQKASASLRPAGLLNRPLFVAGAGKSVVIPAGLHAYAPGHPSLSALPSSYTLTLPVLGDTVSSVSRYDRIYLAVMAVEVTAEIDATIAFEFQWLNQADELVTLSKENTRRYRTVWSLVWAQASATVSAFLSALPVADGVKQIQSVSKNLAGMSVGAYRLYPLDAGLLAGKTYGVVDDTVHLIELCRVWRSQNYNQNGYVWGLNGEASFETDYHIQPSYTYVGDGWNDYASRTAATLRRVALGLPLLGSPQRDRSVVNLLNGQVGTNTQAPGVAGASPNGSNTIANDQRVSFVNEARVQKYYCQRVTTTNTGGRAVASLSLETSVPIGSRFSAIASDHKVYSLNGVEVNGTWTGLGGSGTLTWTNTDGGITPGHDVFVMPGIFYPAGSGFNVAGTVETIYFDGTEIDGDNVLEAALSDLTAYEAPANGEDHIVVMGMERAGIHYVYKKFTVTADSGGIVRIPLAANGAIAFIEGTNAPTSRQDRPAIAGLSAGQSYNLLCYHAPLQTEQWQFQMKTTRYQGSKEASWLHGSTVMTSPIAIAHCLGGGASVFRSDGEYRYIPIALNLPRNGIAAATKAHTFNARIQFLGEGYPGGELGYRNVTPTAVDGYTLPVPGQTLTFAAGSAIQLNGISGSLAIAQIPLGVSKVPLVSSSDNYQLAIAFCVGKDGDRRAVIATFNQSGVSAINSDAPHYAAFDTFNLW